MLNRRSTGWPPARKVVGLLRHDVHRYPLYIAPHGQTSRQHLQIGLSSVVWMGDLMHACTRFLGLEIFEDGLVQSPPGRRRVIKRWAWRTRESSRLMRPRRYGFVPQATAGYFTVKEARTCRASRSSRTDPARQWAPSGSPPLRPRTSVHTCSTGPCSPGKAEEQEGRRDISILQGRLRRRSSSASQSTPLAGRAVGCGFGREPRSSSRAMSPEPLMYAMRTNPHTAASRMPSPAT